MIDTNSDTWHEIADWVDDELFETARKLASKSSQFDETMFNRGYYAALSALKSLPQKETVSPIEVDTYF